MRLRDVRNVVLAAGIAAVVTCLPALDYFDRLDLDVLHWLRELTRQYTEQPNPSQVVVIAIDESTYEMPFFNGKPTVMWTPQLARVMNEVLDAGAAVVGWDIVLPLSVGATFADRKFDMPLLRSLARGRRDGRIVLGEAFGDKPIRPHRLFSIAAGRAQNVRALNIHTDPDGIVRGVPIFFDRKKGDIIRRQPSFALELTARATGTKPVVGEGKEVRLGDYLIPDSADNVLNLNFDGRPGAIPIYSFGDLYYCAKRDEESEKRYFKHNFADKIVVIGAVLEQQDRRLASNRFITSPDTAGAPESCISKQPTSVGITRRAYPGVLIHATAINNLLRHNILEIVSRNSRVMIAFSISLVVAGLTLVTRSPLRCGLAGLGVCLLWTSVTVLAFKDGLVLPLFDALASSSLSFGGLLGYRFVVSDRERARITKSFSLYLAPAIMERMLSQDSLPELGGESRKLTVLFSDIESFTPVCEGMSPAEVLTFLNQYLGIMSDTIEKHGGFVDKYIGDAVVAVFGAPVDDENHALSAVRAALECQRVLAAQQDKFDLPGGNKLKMRIGVNTGDMLAGNIGSSRRFNYTVLGDAVNLASRLESANKQYGSHIMVGDSTAALCKESLQFRMLDTVRVVGRSQPVKIFEPLGEIGETSQEHIVTINNEKYAEALADYRAGDFEVALTGFLAIEGDPVAQKAADRTRALIDNPPLESWDGVTSLDSK